MNSWILFVRLVDQWQTPARLAALGWGTATVEAERPHEVVA